MKEIITSAKNQRIMYLQSLLQKKYRDIESKFVIEGLRLLREALQSKASIEEVFVSPEFLEKNPGFDEDIPENITVTHIKEHLFKKFSDTETPQGVAALVSKEEQTVDGLFTADPPFLLIIDEVRDPGNLGTIIRTADAAGVTGIIMVRGCADLYNPKTLRSTMGSLFHVPVVNVEAIGDLCVRLREHNIRLIVTELSSDSNSYLNADLMGPLALVVGNEARGAAEVILEAADEKIIIPMPGQAESLNVAVAAGIIIFEAVRQRTCN